MKPLRAFGFLAALAALIVGCNSNGDNAAAGANPPAGASSTQATPVEGGASTAMAFADVQPIFEARCVACHGENGKEDVDLRTHESVMKGGEHGPIVKAGEPENSLLIHVLKGDHGAPRMPFKQDPLSDDEIQKIEQWIRDGAKA